ncbi:hypothetical protein SLEP1_g26986 [Rubroshorea leprosula]|uniref:Uncharacterized protein n=1 Tax=Rubroshorea leprosula TaxID=152421 RepID=A0AAV5JP01_9ROSI|nr:hypothetical protein SLEP1_g26986 [Rubroshorea leprosula]
MTSEGEDDDWRRRGRSVLSMEEGGEQRRAEIREVVVESPTAGIREAVGRRLETVDEGGLRLGKERQTVVTGEWYW